MPVIPTNKKLEKRHDKDNYITPDGVAIAHALQAFYVKKNAPLMVLDVGSGTGVYGWAVRQILGREVIIEGVDIRSFDTIKADNDENFTARNLPCYNKVYFERATLPDQDYDLIIGNPPFNIAEQLIGESVKQLNKNGLLSFLLRSNYLESRRRYEGLFSKFPLTKYDFLIDRIAWRNHAQGAKGKVDYETYALYHWLPDANNYLRRFTTELISWKDLFEEWLNGNR